jgi:hypothetical protein
MEGSEGWLCRRLLGARAAQHDQSATGEKMRPADEFHLSKSNDPPVGDEASEAYNQVKARGAGTSSSLTARLQSWLRFHLPTADPRYELRESSTRSLINRQTALTVQDKAFMLVRTGDWEPLYTRSAQFGGYRRRIVCLWRLRS